MTPESRPPVTIYTRRWCGYCVAARRLLNKRGVEYTEIPVDGKPDLRRSVAEANSNWPTVPMVFIGDHFVGGYRELSKLNRTGELDALLEGAA
jgi:glutaredoxin 3